MAEFRVLDKGKAERVYGVKREPISEFDLIYNQLPENELVWRSSKKPSLQP